MSTRKRPRRRGRLPKRAEIASLSPDAEGGARPFSLRIAAACAVVIAVAAATSAALLLTARDGKPSTPAAVIIDQLASTDPNQEFVDDATARLEAAGYRVDHLSGDEIDVELFRTLPKRGYDVILVRNHVGQLERREEPVIIDTGKARALVPAVLKRQVATFFTNELYSRERHVEEQYERLLGVATYPPPSEDGRAFFGVTPEFIGEANGDFGGAVVILMGCGGRGSAAMAQAFLDKGAGSVVSWDDLVTAHHTDGATADLLDRVLANEPVATAVAATMAAIGPDPSFGATLRVYE